MESEAIDVVRAQYEAANRRDFERVMELYDEDVVLVVHGDLRKGVFEGREATGRWFGEWLSTFDDDARFDVTEMTELADGTILLVADHRARGRASGVEVTDQVVWRYTVSDGKITRVEGFETREEAVANV